MKKKAKSVKLDLKLRKEQTTIFVGEETPYENATFTYSVREAGDNRLWNWDVNRDDNGYGGPALRTDCVSGYAASKPLALIGVRQAIKYMLGDKSS